MSLLGSALEAKRLELLHQMVPGTSPIGILLNPKYPDFDLELHELQDAANVINRQVIVARASTQTEIDAAFTMITQQAAGALLIAQRVLWYPARPSGRPCCTTQAARDLLSA